MESYQILLDTIKGLSAILLTAVPVVMFVVQWIKERTGLADKSAEIMSMVVGFLSSGLIGFLFAYDAGYQLTLGQWIGMVLFVLFGTIGPSGGYKLIGMFTGSRKQE